MNKVASVSMAGRLSSIVSSAHMQTGFYSAERSDRDWNYIIDTCIMFLLCMGSCKPTQIQVYFSPSKISSIPLNVHDNRKTQAW